MKFEKRSLKVDMYGEAMELSFPTVGETDEYSMRAKKGEGDADYNATEDLLVFLETCGLPKHVSKDMESEHLEQLLSKLVPTRKK